MYVAGVWFRSLGLADLVLIAALVVAVVAAAAMSRRRGVRGWGLVVCVMVATYAAALVVLEYCPLPSLSPPAQPTVPSWWPDQTPEAANTITWDPGLGLPDGSWWSLENQQLMNVVMMLPFGVFLRVLSRRGVRLLATLAVAVPVAIELSHYVVSIAVGYSWRAAQMTDVMHKALGGLLGIALGAAVLWVASRRRTENSPSAGNNFTPVGR